MDHLTNPFNCIQDWPIYWNLNGFNQICRYSYISSDIYEYWDFILIFNFEFEFVIRISLEFQI